jgi:hypothetical protein
MRLAIVKSGKSAGQAAHRVAVQGAERAKLTGPKLAGHIIAVQRAAGLDPRLMRESARSDKNSRGRVSSYISLSRSAIGRGASWPD